MYISMACYLFPLESSNTFWWLLILIIACIRRWMTYILNSGSKSLFISLSFITQSRNPINISKFLHVFHMIQKYMYLYDDEIKWNESNIVVQSFYEK